MIIGGFRQLCMKSLIQYQLVSRGTAFVSRLNHNRNLNILGFIFGGVIFQNFTKYNTILLEQQEKAQLQNQNSFQNIEKFSDQLYRQYTDEKCDVIIIYYPDRFMDSFQQEIYNVIRTIQLQQKKRPVKLMVLEALNPEEQKQFEEKYNCYIEYDTLLLLKNKYIQNLSPFGAQEYFDEKTYLQKYFTKINKLNNKNYESFKQILPYLPEEGTMILMKVSKDSKHYQNFKRRFNIIQLNPIYCNNPNIHWFMIDDETAKNFGIADAQDGQFYFLLKSGQRLDNKFNFQTGGKKFLISPASSVLNKKVSDVVEENALKFNSICLFADKSFEIPSPQYTCILEADMNKLTRTELKSLIKIFQKLKVQIQKQYPELENKIEFRYVKRNIQKATRKYNIYIRDDIKNMDKSQEHSITDMKQMEKLSTFNDFVMPHSYTYLMKESVDFDSIVKFFNNVKNGEEKEYFKSQSTAPYRKHSIKLCGKNFRNEVINDPQTSVVFHYSKHCHACKKYGKDYELLALDALKNNQNIRFGRINNDRNQLDCSINFNFTPVFEVFKAEEKQKPYIYKHQIFTPELLSQFIYITSNFNLIDENSFQKIQNEYKKISLI